MSNLQYRQQKIQEKRKQTPFRDFVMEICSRHSFNFYRNNNNISRYPRTGREGIVEDIVDQYNQNLIGVNNGDSFRDNFSDLRHGTKKGHLLKFFGDENCQYSDAVFGAKNGYLSFEIGFGVTNVLYSFLIFSNTHNVYNSIACGENSGNLYQSLSVTASSNIFFSKDIDSSHEIWFSSDIIGCTECALCDGLRNQEFCFENRQYSKEEYTLLKEQCLRNKKNFSDLYNKIGFHSENNKFCVNVLQGYRSKYINTGRNLIYAVGGENGSGSFFDSIDVGINSEHFYGVSAAGNNSSHIYCSTQINTCSNIYCSFHLDNCSFCLGCIGLKNKSYCILNKQYTKEDRYTEVDKIFGQMETDGTLGSFFPATMNPFYFNDTAAYLIDPTFTKEEVTAKGYLRRDEPIKVDIPPGVQTVKTSELGQFESFDTNGKLMINDEILKKVILDSEGNAYRIIPMELEFLRKYELPLPRKHRLDRMKENFRIS